MKKVYLLSLFLLFNLNAFAQEPFITTWQTTADNETITIPTEGDGYNYSVEWGDGNSDSELTGDATHEYDTAGIYTVSVSGDFPRIYFRKSDSDRNKIMTIEHWGDIEWNSMASAFYNCENLKYNATDAPDLSKVTNMSSMFNDAPLINGDFNSWDVSSVENMSSMFSYFNTIGNSFNGNISDWDVGSVVEMRNMFWNARAFNGDLSNWDVSKVKNMSTMFAGAISFNGEISQWDVSSVTVMTTMFAAASSFNGDLSNWNVSNVSNMSGMFGGTASFNSDLIDWDVSNVTDMSGMFSGARSFNGDIISWDVSNVTNMGSMFSNAESFDGDISSWDVSNVTDMGSMFLGAILFNGDLSSWDISNVANMNRIFKGAAILPQNYDNILNAWSSLDALQENVELGAEGLYYCEGDAGRNTLINDYGWIIIDEGKNCRFQRIFFGPFQKKVYGDNDLFLDAYAVSGMPINYFSSNKEVATVIGDTVTIKGAGIAQIAAFAGGNENFDPSDTVTRQLLVLRANQSITFDSIPKKPYWANDFTINAKASSELPVSFISSNLDVAMIVNDSMVNLKNPGTTLITAFQGGNNNHNRADDITRELVVLKSEVTSVKNINRSEVQLFPNPIKDVLHIENISEFNFVRIYNSEGKLIEKYDLDRGELKIDLKAQPQGVYFIRMDAQNEVFKILKN